jgi:hypothetical protein
MEKFLVSHLLLISILFWDISIEQSILEKSWKRRIEALILELLRTNLRL